MNLKQIRSIVKRNTGADTMNMPDYSIDQFINLAQKEVVRQTLCLKGKVVTTTQSVAITSIIDYGSTVTGTVAVKSSAHGLSTGDTIYITGTTNYNGRYSITEIGATDFYITATYVATNLGGTWGKDEYALPSDFHKSTLFKIGSYTLEYKPEEFIDSLYTTNPATGAPYYFYIDLEAGKYGLYPIPMSVIKGSFIYKKKPATLAIDADIPDIPELYHDLIVSGASYRVAEQLNKPDIFNHYYALFGALMSDMANDMAIRQSDYAPTIIQSADILDA
jgi:hypothetical protein